MIYCKAPILHMGKSLKKIIKKPLYYCLRGYFIFRSWRPFWFYLLNYKARRHYLANKPILNEVQKRIVADFKKNGIAVAHLDELFPGQNMTSKLVSYVNKLKAAAEIKTVKTFLRYMFEERPVIETDNPFALMALEPAILAIINSYFDFSAIFYYLTLNITMPVPKDAAAVASQCWHRDPEDRKMAKLFIYLNDVNERAGPFTYVLGSHSEGKYRNIFPQRPPKGIYPPLQAVEKSVMPQDIKAFTGRTGTIIFCDTSGLHKGGYATGAERIMFTAGYCTRSSRTLIRYDVGDSLKNNFKQLTAAQRYALTPVPKKITFYCLYLFKRLQRSFKYDAQEMDQEEKMN